MSEVYFILNFYIIGLLESRQDFSRFKSSGNGAGWRSYSPLKRVLVSIAMNDALSKWALRFKPCKTQCASQDLISYIKQHFPCNNLIAFSERWYISLKETVSLLNPYICSFLIFNFKIIFIRYL